MGLPWWLTGKQSACQGRRHRFDPQSGKIPHPAKQLSSCMTTTEPVPEAWEPQLLSPCDATTEARAPSLCSVKREDTQ